MSGKPFRPALWLPGRHLQTIVPALLPAPTLGTARESLVVEVEPGSSVRVDIDRPSGRARGTLLLVHGMAGSSEARYMRRTAREALGRGWVTARMNLRGCGGTVALSPTLHNAGQHGDVAAVLGRLDAERFPRPFGAAGFSLGGNIVLLHAGRAGPECAADALAGVNAPVDLEACCRALERPGNRLYQRYFVRGLCRLLEEIRLLHPVPGPEARPRAIRTLRRFDDAFTAPSAGYVSAAEYYAGSSSGPWLHAVQAPALVLSAANDPFVDVRTYEPLRRSAAPGVRFVHPAHGGHVGYRGRRAERFWAAGAVLDHLDESL